MKNLRKYHPVPDPSTREKGNAAEVIARRYLEDKGYRILDTNWYHGRYELDIVALDGEELVIVEVRSKSGENFEHPEDAIPDKKIRHVISAADGWIRRHGWDKNTRFDLITVALQRQGACELNHYDHAFFPEPI